MAFAVIYSLAALPLGRLADRANRKKLLLLGVALWTLGTAACALATDFRQLFISRVVVGLGEAGLYPAGTSLLVAYFPPQRRATAIGIFFMGSAFGAGTAVLGGGALLISVAAFTSRAGVETLTAWRWVLLVLSVPGLIVFALLLPIREPARVAMVPKPGHLSSSGLGSIWKSRWFILFLLLAQMFQALVDYGSSAWMPALLVRKFGLTPGVAGVHLGLVDLVAAAIGPTLGGLLSDRLQAAGRERAKSLLAATAFFLGIPFLYCAVSGSPWLSIFLFGGLTLLMGVGIVAAVTAIQDAIDDTARATAIALQSFFSTIVGLGCGPTLVALLSDRVFGGPQFVGTAIAAVAVPGLLCAAVAALVAYRIRAIPAPTAARMPTF